jgi:hypothetical protein
MLVRLILQLYTYITNILCPAVKTSGSNKYIHRDDDIDDNPDIDETPDDIDDYIDQPAHKSLDTVVTKKHNPYDSDEYDESYDMVYDMDKTLYSIYRKKARSNPIFTPSTTLKKSQSYVIQNYYCGYCSRNIRVPEHMYYNKTYCSIYCRNTQIQLDESGSSQIREHHSFSM